MLEIQFDADAALKAMEVSPRRTQRAVVRALNRALSAGRKLMTSLIAKEMGVSSKAARAQVWTVEAVESRPEVRLRASLKRVPLINLGAKGPTPSRGRGRGVKHHGGSDIVYRVSKNSYSPADTAVAFIATMKKSGHQGVFQRATKARLPIHELYGPSFGTVFDRHRPTVVARMHEAFEKRISHELEFANKETA